MDYISELEYIADEVAINTMLKVLFSQWHETAKSKIFVKNYIADNMVFDGFYPYYTKQNVKTLFIGRESLGLTGENYIDIIFDGYKQNQLDGRTINQYKTHRLLLKICYGLNNGLCSFGEIPSATSIVKHFGTANGISCAFMNLSKFSNDSDSKNADWGLINGFLNEFKDDNFGGKEIEILNPDIIISMNLESHLDNFGESNIIDCTNDIAYRKLQIGNKTYNVLDTFHFAARKNEEFSYYKPIVDMCLKHDLLKMKN